MHLNYILKLFYELIDGSRTRLFIETILQFSNIMYMVVFIGVCPWRGMIAGSSACRNKLRLRDSGK